jgi:hypothetical protein
MFELACVGVHSTGRVARNVPYQQSCMYHVTRVDAQHAMLQCWAVKRVGGVSNSDATHGWHEQGDFMWGMWLFLVS